MQVYVISKNTARATQKHFAGHRLDAPVLNNPPSQASVSHNVRNIEGACSCEKNVSRLHAFIGDVITTPPGINFPRPTWVRFNRLQTGVGLFRSETYKWVMASTVACECGAKEKKAEHVITSYPIYYHPNGICVLSGVDKSLAT